MYIRMLFGRNAGTVQDIEPVTARELLACGRAEDPDTVKTNEPTGAIAEPAVIERPKNKQRK